MVSSFDFSCDTVHVGVIRRSVTKWGSLLPLVAGVVIMTETSVGVGWKAIIDVIGRRVGSKLMFSSQKLEFPVLGTLSFKQEKARG